MIIFGDGDWTSRFVHTDTEHPCPCGEKLFQVGGTTYLYCRECGEERWLIPA